MKQPFITQIAQAPLEGWPSSVLHTDKFTLVGTSDGHIVQYSGTLQLQTSIPVSRAPIEHISQISSNYVVLAGGEVTVYDETLDELEKLPFKDILALDVKHGKQPLLAIATKYTLIVYTYWDHLEMTAQHKFAEKLVAVKFVADGVIAASNTSFYRVNENDESTTKLDVPSSGFSILTKNVSILDSSQGIILSRGSSKLLYSKKLGPKRMTFTGDAQAIVEPFIIAKTGNHIHAYDIQGNKHWFTQKVDKLLLVSTYDREIVTVSKTSISKFVLKPDKEIINSISDIQSAIDLISQMTYQEKHLKLRQLQVQLATDLFKRGDISSAMDKFIEFCACPLEVIELYPSYISQRDISISDDDELDTKSVELLTYFLSDCRRKISKLINAPENKLPYKNSSLTLDLFTDSNHSIDEIRTAVDTTLFKCYTLINPGLIGSLIRVDNHCDPQLVVTTLKKAHAVDELIDFYFKRGLHEEALHMLSDTSTDQVVKYLQRLKNDNLDLIMKYASPAIDKEEGYGIQIFINSPYSDEFDRYTVMKYLEKHDTLERMFLEYIVYELHEKATIFHTKLALLYLEKLQPDPDDLVYKKMYKFLQIGNYDKRTVLSKFPSSDSPSLILLKSFILSGMGLHKQVLDIQVNSLKEPALAIQYIREHNTQELFLELLSLLQRNNDKDSTLRLLSSTTTSTPISAVLDLMPSFKVHDLENYLTKSIRIQQKQKRIVQLEKNLLDVERVSTALDLMQKENQKVNVDQSTMCEICGRRIGGSVLLWDAGEQHVRHFGCKKPTKNNKLNILSMTDYDDEKDLVVS